MLKIRLQRVGRKHDPSFRVVLSDSRRAAQSGGFLEILGNYDPRKHAENFQANSARIAEWISRGAQLSGTVHNLFVDAKLVPGPKRNVSPKANKKTELKATSKAAPEATSGKENTAAPAGPSKDGAGEMPVLEDEKTLAEKGAGVDAAPAV